MKAKISELVRHIVRIKPNDAENSELYQFADVLPRNLWG